MERWIKQGKTDTRKANKSWFGFHQQTVQFWCPRVQWREPGAQCMVSAHKHVHVLVLTPQTCRLINAISGCPHDCSENWQIKARIFFGEIWPSTIVLNASFVPGENTETKCPWIAKSHMHLESRTRQFRLHLTAHSTHPGNKLEAPVTGNGVNSICARVNQLRVSANSERLPLHAKGNNCQRRSWRWPNTRELCARCIFSHVFMKFSASTLRVSTFEQLPCEVKYFWYWKQLKDVFFRVFEFGNSSFVTEDAGGLDVFRGKVCFSFAAALASLKGRKHSLGLRVVRYELHALQEIILFLCRMSVHEICWELERRSWQGFYTNGQPTKNKASFRYMSATRYSMH